MQKLQLPPFETKVRTLNAKRQIFDDIRKKWVALTPEEWVRQHFVHYLQTAHGVPAALMAVERALRYNGLVKRFDIVVYDKTMHPWMIVECKAPTVRITAETFYQAAAYDKVLGATYLSLTNGLRHHCCKIQPNGTVEPLQSFPQYPSEA